MLASEIDLNKIAFFFKNKEGLIPISLCKGTLQHDEYGAFLLLQEMAENGTAKIIGDKFVTQHEEIAALPPLDQQLLNLPPDYPFQIRIDSKGRLNQESFGFDLGFYEHPQGNRFEAERVGAILTIDREYPYLLSSDQLALCDAVDEFNGLPSDSKTFPNNLLRFSDIKDLSTKSAAVLDSYLSGESVIAPHKVSIHIANARQENVEIVPAIEGVKGDFEKKFRQFPESQGIYNFQDAEGNRQRVVFTKKQQDELQKVKNFMRLPREKQQQIIETPQEYFDPDILDLDAYSKRVVEIGIYKPRFYPFISPYQSQWIPGILIEQASGVRKQIKVQSKSELESLRRFYDQAVREGEKEVSWKDIKIPVEEVAKLIRIAEKQFQSTKPIAQDPESGDKVLIIKENILEKEFVEYVSSPTDEKENLITYEEPPHLKSDVNLLAHQKEGVEWLQRIYRKHLCGGLLADDMGLGKTLQALGFILWFYEKSDDTGQQLPTLVVAPVALLENWEREYHKFFADAGLQVVRMYGDYCKNILRQTTPIERIRAEVQKPNIVLTNYETLRNHQLRLCAVDWAIVLLDEAQRVKTPGTLITNAVKALKSKFKIALTGTPVENSWMDLWCIIDFIAPGLLGSAKEFDSQYCKPLKNIDSDAVGLGQQIRQDIGSHLLRRMKNDILSDLPPKYVKPKNETSAFMPRGQLDRYQLELEEANKFDPGEEGAHNKVLRAIWALRAISDHPFILEKQIERFDLDELVGSSAKLEVTCRILDEIKPKEEKVILFSDRKETQRLLAKIIRERYGLNPSVINGDTPAYKGNERSSIESRQQAIDRFEAKDGFNAIILSPLATGVGLNITRANHVIHYTRHWNPAKEDQATDRVHRIGQTNAVHVYYPMAIAQEFKTFDVVLDELLERKRVLATTSLFPTDQAEVDPFEVFSNLSGQKTGQFGLSSILIEDADKLDPLYFEALIATLFQEQGHRVQLTPKSNDKGADIVVRNGNDNFLIQVKHSNRELGHEAVGEILKARGYYENKYQIEFSLRIVTNWYFSNSARKLAKDNKIAVLDRTEITKLLREHKISLRDILVVEKTRLAEI